MEKKSICFFKSHLKTNIYKNIDYFFYIHFFSKLFFLNIFNLHKTYLTLTNQKHFYINSFIFKTFIFNLFYI